MPVSGVCQMKRLPVEFGLLGAIVSAIGVMPNEWHLFSEKSLVRRYADVVIMLVMNRSMEVYVLAPDCSQVLLGHW